MKKNTSKATKKYSRLSLAEREEIAISPEKGLKQYEIAVLLNRNRSTVSREIKRNISTIRNVGYRANRAQSKADRRKAQSRHRQRIPNKKLRRYICKYLREGYSPEIIAAKAYEKMKDGKRIMKLFINGYTMTAMI